MRRKQRSVAVVSERQLVFFWRFDDSAALWVQESEQHNCNCHIMIGIHNSEISMTLQCTKQEKNLVVGKTATIFQVKYSILKQALALPSANRS